MGVDNTTAMHNQTAKSYDSFSSLASSRRAQTLLPKWASDLHLHSLCGDENHALFGSCIASTGKFLWIQLGSTEPINPGLAFSVSVWKVDFYNQTVTSDSSTFLKIQAEPLAHSGSGVTEPLLAAVVSGEAVFQLIRGHATVSVIVKPYFAAIVADSGQTLLASEVAVYAEGIDDESSTMLRCIVSSVYVNG
jgi:hypothetical protein